MHKDKSPSLDFYCKLATRLFVASIKPSDLSNHLSDAPHLAEPDARALLAEAVECSHADPREGWALAAVVYAAAHRANDARLRCQSAFALVETLINGERYDQALQVLDDERLAVECLGETLISARWIWLRGLVLTRLIRVAEAADALARAGELLHSEASTQKSEAGSQAQVRALEMEYIRWQRGLARVEMLQEHHDQALSLAQACLDYFRNQAEALPGDMGLCEVIVAAVHYARGDYALAREALASGCAHFDVAGWLTDRARAQLVAAQTFQYQARYAEARALCEQLHPTLETLDLPVSLARCDNTLGLVHLYQGNPDAAVPYLKNARDGFMRAGVYAFAADGELNLGTVFYNQGDFQAAIEQYRRAHDLYQQHHYLAHVTHCEHNIGRCYREMGDYGRALDHFTRAQAEFSRLGRKADLAICSHNMAFTYLLLGDAQRAMDHLNEALALYNDLGQVVFAAECHTELALIVAGQGDARLALSQVQRARSACQQADYAPGLAICDRTEGDVLSRIGQYGAAIGFYQQARQTFEQCGYLLDKTLCELGLVNAYLHMGEWEQAQTSLDSALTLADERVSDVSWWAEALCSRLAEARRDTEKAVEAALRAVDHLGRARRSLPDESLINIFLNVASVSAGVRLHVYDRAIALALESGHSQSALQVIEERRAQLIASQLRWARLPSDSPQMDKLRQRRTRLQAQIVELRSALQPGFDSSAYQRTAEPATGHKQATLAQLDRLRSLMSEYEQTVLDARNTDWSALELPRDVPPFSLDAFQQTMASLAQKTSGWTSLSYIWLDDQLVIVHLNDQGCLEFTRPALSAFDRMALKMMADPNPDWRKTMYSDAFSTETADTQVGEIYRRRAYDILLPPLAQQDLAEDRLLLVVPSGLLYHLPFAALQCGNIFLAQQALVHQSPSLQVVNLLNARRLSRSNDNRLLAIAVDTFQGDIPALPSVNKEIAAVRLVWPGEMDVLQGNDATLAAFQQLRADGALATYRVIHFATHAVFDGEHGLLSRLLLRDGSLFVDDIRALRLAADLVVLSACQTGLGQSFSGDEILGLAYSFLAAGAQAVIASLWHVNDLGAGSLMHRFYEQYSRHASSVKALSLAQRSAIADGWPPYFWAPFTLVGLP